MKKLNGGDRHDPMKSGSTDHIDREIVRGQFWLTQVGCCSIRERQGLLLKLGVFTRFADSSELAEGILEYGSWVRDNPLYESKLVTYEGVSTLEEIPKVRAMSMSALYLFLGISQQTWYNYRADPVFAEVCTIAEKMVYNQKFEAASAGLLNAMIISRDLGLAERKELSGPNGAPLNLITSDMDPKEAAALYASTLNGE